MSRFANYGRERGLVGGQTRGAQQTLEGTLVQRQSGR